MNATKPASGGIGKLLIRLLITLLVGAVVFYIELPPLNPHSGEFWGFLAFLVIVYVLLTLVFSGLLRMNTTQEELAGEVIQTLKKSCKIPVILISLIAIVWVIGSILSSTVLNATAYYNLLDVQTGDFTEDVAEISYDKIPMLDSDSTIQLGSRALGSIVYDSNLVSQFEVSSSYSQINYQNEPVRVAPLEYGNLVKWFNNRSDGIPGYIIVNMVTQEARLVQLDEGIKYSTCEHFSRNVYRLLRFNYPTMMFGDINFEIDEDGTPYWVCSRVVKTIGLFGGEDTQGAVLVNAITGECTYYEEVPSWVDRVYPAEQLVQQYNYHGTLVNGWINSWLGQKGITTTSTGYNYIALNDDVYLYTGVTSVGNDESNVGFILINQRTKEAKYYQITGATEESAMSSAEGAVQHLSYDATFPLLLNISDQPTYFISLKDSAQLVKMYAMVNVTDYQITATGSTVEECQANYTALLVSNGIPLSSASSEVADAEEDTVSGTITDIRTIVVSGYTVFYFSLGDGYYYVISAEDCPEAVIFNVGDKVTITYTPSENSILTAGKIEFSVG